LWEVTIMNDEHQSQIIARAKAHWDAGIHALAGSRVFEHIPLTHCPIWAANLLQAVYQHIPPVPEVTAVLEFGWLPEQWPRFRAREAHEIFDAVRRINNMADVETVQHQIFDLAEDAAGVIYTARQYPAPFDYERGWRIVERYYRVVQRLSLDMSQAWDIVADKRYILQDLDASFRCTIGCPLCNAEASKNA